MWEIANDANDGNDAYCKTEKWENERENWQTIEMAQIPAGNDYWLTVWKSKKKRIWKRFKCTNR